MPVEKVRFSTFDEIELVGHLYLPDQSMEGWSPGVIMCHDFGASKESHVDWGERAMVAGFATLVMDLRGHGESGGEVDANIFNDVAAAVSYMQSRAEVHPMYMAIRGVGMGGWLAIHTAAHIVDLAPVIATAPSNEAQLTLLMEEVSMVQRGHTSPLVPQIPPRTNVNSMVQLLYRLDVLKAARRISPRPLLLIHCEGDEVTPAHISQQIYDEAAEPKALWLLPDCDHEFAEHDEGIDRRVFEWIALMRPLSGRLKTGDLRGEEP